VVALRDAELIAAELNSAFPRHSDAELFAAVREQLQTGRDPRELLAELLREQAKDDGP